MGEDHIYLCQGYSFVEASEMVLRNNGLSVQSGVDAALSRQRSRVRIPYEPQEEFGATHRSMGELVGSAFSKLRKTTTGSLSLVGVVGERPSSN